MSDQSLWQDLEQFQELSEQESETVIGGISYSNLSYSNSLDIKYLNLGACPACRSGFDPLVIGKYNDIVNPLNQAQLF